MGHRYQHNDSQTSRRASHSKKYYVSLRLTHPYLASIRNHTCTGALLVQECALRAQQLQLCTAASVLSWVGCADTHDRILYSILWLLIGLKYFKAKRSKYVCRTGLGSNKK